MKTSALTFTGYHKPHNYKRIDSNVVRSAQPEAEEIVWLKKHRNLTDIINFRTLIVPNTDFNEEKFADALNIKYHSIPTATRHPKLDDVKSFLNIIKSIKERDGQVLIHCKAGADRTGMYSLIYKVLNGLSNFDDAAQEMLALGHHQKTYPTLIDTAKEFIKQLKK